MDCSFTALDAYFGVSAAPVRFQRFDGDIVGLVKAFDGLSFPGLPYADAVADAVADGKSPAPRIRFQCADSGSMTAYPQTRLLQLPGKRSFDARDGIYERLRDTAPIPAAASPELVLFEAAALAARYGYSPDPEYVPQTPRDLPAEYGRDLLELVVTGPHPEKGFELLRRSGFVALYWPELAVLAGVAHTKDFHPEGDAWAHTMDTFSHRKTADLTLSLGLLLHDIGKPEAISSGGHRFDGHSELGERAARGFLSRLGYPRETIAGVAFLVRYHMLPAGLPRIPPSSLAGVLDNTLFPTLLELYRCDELSTFRGPDGYYDACAAYKAYLKNSRNPYRDDNGKRLQNSLHRPTPRAL